MEEYILAPRTNILWNAVLTVVAIIGLTELLRILPWDIPELIGFAFMDVIDLARANFMILDITNRVINLATIVLLAFWTLAGLAAGARSRHAARGVISGLLGGILLVLIVVIGGIILEDQSINTALPPIVGIIIGLGTTTIVGGIGGALTSSTVKMEMKRKTTKIWTKDEKWVCPNCGAEIPPGAFICPSCGIDVIE
ncbi:MAG: zinc-ribbon domain-containing protein [Candidatus Heimdallarchaeota archaeon]